MEELMVKSDADRIADLEGELKKSVDYMEYLAAALDDSISYSEYLAIKLSAIVKDYGSKAPVMKFKEYKEVKKNG